MRHHLTTVSLMAFVAGGLSACGGGGSPGWVTDAAPFTSVASLPANGSVALDGEARKATLVVDPVFLEFALTNVSGRQDASAAVLFSSGSPIAAEGKTAGLTVTLDTRTGAQDDSSIGLVSLASADDSEYIILVLDDSTGLDHQSLGSWVSYEGDTSAIFAVGSFGSATPIGDMPSGVPATYTGISEGYATDGDGYLYITLSDVTMTTTDFSSVTFSSDNTYVVDILFPYMGYETALDFSGELDIDGGTFSGSVSGGTVSGSASGTFFGSAAEEAGGTFGTSGGGWVNIGSFGLAQTSP